MPTFTISFNDELAKTVESEVKKGKYSSKSEYFRNLVRQQHLEEEKEDYYIETIEKDDEDFSLLQKRKNNNKKFVELSEILKHVA